MIYKKYKIFVIVGARPQFIKAAPVLTALKLYKEFEVQLIHTGQHYDHDLSEIFFQELNLPLPAFNLEIGSGDASFHYSSIIDKLSKLIKSEHPDLIVVFGDTNSTGASSVAAAVNQVKLCHIESGLREHDKRIPEEVNKLVTDALADIYFCPTQTALNNLTKAGIYKNVYLSGDPALDICFKYQDRVDQSEVQMIDGKSIPSKYYYATVHRQYNTENPAHLKEIVEAFSELGLPVVWPVHPRTRSVLEQLDVINHIDANQIIFLSPIGFWASQNLIKNAEKVLTDSGGVVKEAYFYGKFVLVLDKQTEWVEVINEGKGVVCGPNKDSILSNIHKIIPSNSVNTSLGNGQASEIIAQEINNYLRHEL